MPDMWVRPLVCPTHGNLHRDDICCRYVCKGFDGEGCDFTITDEELAADAPGDGFTYIGVIKLGPDQ